MGRGKLQSSVCWSSGLWNHRAYRAPARWLVRQRRQILYLISVGFSSNYERTLFSYCKICVWRTWICWRWHFNYEIKIQISYFWGKFSVITAVWGPKIEGCEHLIKAIRVITCWHEGSLNIQFLLFDIKRPSRILEHQLEGLFWELVGSLRGGVLFEAVGHWGQILGF